MLLFPKKNLCPREAERSSVERVCPWIKQAQTNASSSSRGYLFGYIKYIGRREENLLILCVAFLGLWTIKLVEAMLMIVMSKLLMILEGSTDPYICTMHGLVSQFY